MPLSAAELSPRGSRGSAAAGIVAVRKRLSDEPRLPRPRPGILDIAPYVGGEAKIPASSARSGSPRTRARWGPAPRRVAAYRALAGEIHRYPDGGAPALRAALGQHHGLDPARIVCGAGSDELIGLLTRAYAGPGDEVLYSRHGFLMYPIGAQSVGRDARRRAGEGSDLRRRRGCWRA